MLSDVELDPQARDHVFSLIHHDLIQRGRPVLTIHTKMIRSRLGEEPISNKLRAHLISESGNSTAWIAASLTDPKQALAQFMSERGYRNMREVSL